MMVNTRTYVDIAGKKYYPIKVNCKLVLDLSNKQITDLKDIQGLNSLSSINILDLSKNRI